MSEIHWEQPVFKYSACEPFTKNKERIQSFKETGGWRCLYQKELDKVCFQHDIAYGDFKDLPRRTASVKVLRDKEFNITDGHKTSTSGGAIKSKNILNKQVTEELHKPVTKKFENSKV